MRQIINRTQKASQYVFNANKGILEKLDTVQDIPKKATEQNERIVNTVTVITAADNLVHNYFYSYETSWDATDCLQVAIIKMPKMNQENINYWASYTGELTIYMGTNIARDNVNQTTHGTEQDAVDSLTMYSKDATLLPYFRGEINHIKEYQNHIIIYVHGIGYRFKQKIPEEFRQKFIYNQNVRDSFQAICEFLGVPYICPPQTVTENQEEQQATESNTDGNENEVTQQLENTQNIANQAKNIAQNAAQNITQNSNNQQNQNGQDNQQNTNDDGSVTNNTEISDIINGYGDINFDANGAIVHNSTVIETSPDMSQTLINTQDHPLEQYLEDETGIVEKVQKFLNNEMFEELHNAVMDYGAITIQPASTTTTSMSPMNDAANTNSTNLSEESNSSSNGGSSGNGGTAASAHSSTSGRRTSGQKGVWGKTSGGKYYLTADAINKMSMAEAKRRYEDGKKRQIYTAATMQKLWYRMVLGTKFF